MIPAQSSAPFFSDNPWRPASDDKKMDELYGPSRDYSSERWSIQYHSIEISGELSRRKVSCFLPEGYERAYEIHAHSVSAVGPICRVGCFGVQFDPQFLAFCENYMKAREKLGLDEMARREFDLRATSWDLPGHIIIASQRHNLSAEGPSRKIYSFEDWITFEEGMHYFMLLPSVSDKSRRRDRQIKSRASIAS
jgi:hypothetical protein